MIHSIVCDDLSLDLFESQYVVPQGMTYNSYVIDGGDALAIIDTADRRVAAYWQSRLADILDGRSPQYLLVQHLEPDHSALISWVMDQWPSCQIVCSAKAAQMMPQFVAAPLEGRVSPVKEGDTLRVGSHTLHFAMAQMVHWPEVMVTYDETTRTLFSADAFGKFGAQCHETGDWACEARRYYFNICGKYGMPVQSLLKKAAQMDIATICPLHGPVLRDRLDYYTGLYDVWSRYEPETRGVFVAYASLHGNTAAAASLLADRLREAGVTVATADLARADVAECVEDAFRYDRMVLCASSYDGGVMPAMAEFLHHLQTKNFQRRRVAIVENGSWAPSAARTMRKMLDEMRGIEVLEPTVTIRTTLNDTTRTQLLQLADSVAAL